MKRKYIAPSLCCVKISTNAIIAGSLDDIGINRGSSTEVNDANQVWTKENNSVWDEEW